MRGSRSDIDCRDLQQLALSKGRRNFPRIAGVYLTTAEKFRGERENRAMSSPSDRHPVEPHPVVPTQQARQGVTGHNVRYVLGFGIAGIVILFLIIWLAYVA
jgi:hypothetical protein